MKKSMLKRLVMMTLAMGAMYIPGMASAEEAAAPQEFALDEVVVTANRMENKLVDTPANVAVVTAEEIERRNYQDAIEAVKNVPGVDVQGGVKSDEGYVKINGDERVLVLVNGRRINGDKGVSYGRANLDVGTLPPASAIERIEIVKGGSSTVYGTDAVGGVINIITKSGNENYVKIDANTGSWGSQNYKAVISHKEGKTGVFATLGKEKQNYLKYKEANTNSHKKLYDSNSNRVTATIKVEQEITDDQMATLYYEHNLKKGGRPGPWEDLSTLPGAYVRDNGSTLNNNVDLKYDWGRSGDNPGFVRVYRNYNSERYNFDYNKPSGWGPYSSSSKYYEKKIGVDVQQTIKTSDTNTLLVGGTYYNTKIANSSAFDEQGINSKSLFVQDSFNFAPSWTLNSGLRYDNHSNAGSKTTASLAVNKKFNETSHAYVNWSQIFNAPKANDLFWFEDYGGGSGMFGNRNLKPEKGDIWTIGYESKTGRKGNVGVSAFYSQIDDAIRWNNTYVGGYWFKSEVENVDQQKRRGLELNYKYDFDDHWSVNASYAYVKVENKYGDNGYTRYNDEMPNRYKLGVSYTSDKWDVDLYGRGASGCGFASVNNEGYTYRPYADHKYLTLDLAVNYKLKDNWKVYALGYNLTNAAYAEYSGTTKTGAGDIVYSRPAAGRRFLVGTQITF